MKERRVIEIDGIEPALPRRQVVVRPGYDCIRNPCGKNGCGTDPGANHGIHCDEWIYLVRDGSEDCALSLLVFSGVWPESVPISARFALKMPRGADLSFHCSFPADDNDDEDSGKCDWVRGGRCWVSGSSGLAAMEFAKKFFVNEHGMNQREAFWRALEDKFAEWAAPVKRRIN